MTFGKVERDSLGIPVNDTPSPVLRRIRQEEEEKNAADASPNRGNPQGRSDRIQREEQARRDLEEHQRRLADELDEAVARTRPNPWLKPWDPGYESPTLIALRQATEAREPSRPVEGRSDRQEDAGRGSPKSGAKLLTVRKPGDPSARPAAESRSCNSLPKCLPRRSLLCHPRSVKCVDAGWRATPVVRFARPKETGVSARESADA